MRIDSYEAIPRATRASQRATDRAIDAHADRCMAMLASDAAHLRYDGHAVAYRATLGAHGTVYATITVDGVASIVVYS